MPFAEEEDPVLTILRVEMKIGQQYNCTLSYTDKITEQPTFVTASQDVIVEGMIIYDDKHINFPVFNSDDFSKKFNCSVRSKRDLKKCPLSARPPLIMEQGVELPIRGIQSELLTLRVYVDIQMRR